MVSRMQARDSNLSFATAAEMAEGRVVFPKEEGERLKTEAGKHKGLTVILDAHTDLVAEATVSEDFQGSTVRTTYRMIVFGIFDPLSPCHCQSF